MAQDTDGDGVCDLIDDCPNNPDPAQLDSDGDGIGDACDPCNNMVPVFAIKQRVRIRNLNTPPGDDRLTFKGVITVPTTPPIDPATKGCGSCSRTRLAFTCSTRPFPGASIPATGVGWKTNPAGTVWRYRNPQGPSGIVRVRVRSRSATPGRLKFMVIGRHGSYAMSPAHMPLKGTMIIDSPLATTGQCGEALFPGPAPAPHCAFNPSGSTLRCR